MDEAALVTDREEGLCFAGTWVLEAFWFGIEDPEGRPVFG
jgi:hypothetical protein